METYQLNYPQKLFFKLFNDYCVSRAFNIFSCDNFLIGLSLFLVWTLGSVHFLNSMLSRVRDTRALVLLVGITKSNVLGTKDSDAVRSDILLCGIFNSLKVF